LNLLLDTHAFLWMALGSDRWPGRIAKQLRDPDNDVWLSVVSVWELAVKTGTGRLTLPSPAIDFVIDHRRRHRVESLALEEAAVAHLERLPPLHRDPFDRMLVCQAIEHGLTIVTGDPLIRDYPVRTLWLENEGGS
jgi:PIN domain nuclease of toxin-antitoxin system